MMTRKDYEAVAGVLAASAAAPDEVAAMADAFAAGNPRFDRARFVEAATADRLAVRATVWLGNDTCQTDADALGYLAAATARAVRLCDRTAVGAASTRVSDANGNTIGAVWLVGRDDEEYGG